MVETVSPDDGDREEYDFQQLMDLLIMGAQAKYGDSDGDSGNTRAERVEVLKYAALYLEMQEELWAAIQTKACMHSHDAYDRYEESVNEQVLNVMTSKQEPGTLHVPVTNGKAPIYDDEGGPQGSCRASRHPRSSLEALRGRAGPPDTSRHPRSSLEALRSRPGASDTSRRPSEVAQGLRTPPDAWRCLEALRDP